MTESGEAQEDDGPAAALYRATRIAHWDRMARVGRRWQWLGGAYHRRLERIYRQVVPPGVRVLELGCGRGDLLAAVAPSVGVGVDFSGEIIRQATKRHQHLRFLEADAHEIEGLNETFDVIILSDLLNDAWDVQRLLVRLLPVTTPETRIILNVYSHLWQLPLGAAELLGMADATLEQNWLTAEDTGNLLELSGFRLVRRWQEILFPLPIPLVAPLANRFLVRLWPFNNLALSNFFVARRAPREASKTPRVSVIVPARNEAGNIAAVFARTPEMGAGTELIFVEGDSQDGTYEAIEREIALDRDRRVKLLRQRGKGKGDAVRLGFAEAGGDVLMILDADLTVAPEVLPRFLDALRSGRGELINGVRLIYPLEKQAMRFANLVANKLFGLAFTWLLGQPIRDTLCGTKVLHRETYERLSANRERIGALDPFGDFDLLFGAARLGLEIVEVPVRYRERTYGTTNIQRWRHGWLLLKMCFVAASRIKFV